MNFKQNFLNNSIAIKNNLKHLTYLNLLKKIMKALSKLKSVNRVATSWFKKKLR